MSSARPVARTTWQAAARRAEQAPDQRLPCPGCAVSVMGAKLAEHVHRVHLSGPGDMAPGHPIHVGRDRRMRRTIGWAAAVWLVALVGLAALDPTPLADAADAFGDGLTAAEARHHLSALADTPIGPGLVGGIAILVVLALAARGDRARLAVTHQEVVLRHRIGTGTRRVRLPSGVESGTLVRRVGGGDGEGPGTVEPVHDERVGSYLRVGHGRGAITVGCPQGTRERKHWDGWARGKVRRRWDITLGPAEFVAFQYALADAGVLGLPDPPPPGRATGPGGGPGR